MLARSLGRTLEELGQTCSAQEFGLWQAAFEAEPWGPFRTELAAGVVASTIANVNRGRDSEPFTPLDFMPYAKAVQDVYTSAQPQPEPSGADFVREFGG